MIGTERTATTTLVEVTCGACGGLYALAERYVNEKRNKGGYWKCPYCACSWGFGESELQRVQERERAALDSLARERARHDQTKAELQHTEYRRRAVAGHLRRTKTRIAAGVCPCCRRTFQNVASHMKVKRPDFKKDHADAT